MAELEAKQQAESAAEMSSKQQAELAAKRKLENIKRAGEVARLEREKLARERESKTRLEQALVHGLCVRCYGVHALHVPLPQCTAPYAATVCF